jgi:hypothetical protein
MSEEEIWEKMVQELKERRANQKKGVMMTAVKVYGPSVICMDYASLYPMHISMKSILRKRKIAKIYA